MLMPHYSPTKYLSSNQTDSIICPCQIDGSHNGIAMSIFIYLSLPRPEKSAKIRLWAVLKWCTEFQPIKMSRVVA